MGGILLAVLPALAQALPFMSKWLDRRDNQKFVADLFGGMVGGPAVDVRPLVAELQRLTRAVEAVAERYNPPHPSA